jgi:hypothetical protein
MISDCRNKAYFARIDQKDAEKSAYAGENLSKLMKFGSSISEQNISGFSK